jgi:septal ring factor EnvC (AmiA/AmiB activator)
MGWVVVGLVVIIAVLVLVLRYLGRNLAAAQTRANRPPVFGLANLSALAKVINTVEAGQVLNAVLQNLGAENTVAADYQEFDQHNRKNQERLTKTIATDEAEIAKLRRDIDNAKLRIEDLKVQWKEIGTLVANVIPPDAK